MVENTECVGRNDPRSLDEIPLWFLLPFVVYGWLVKYLFQPIRSFFRTAWRIAWWMGAGMG